MRLPDRPLRVLRRSPMLSARIWRRRLGFWVGAVLVSLVAIGFARATIAADALFHGAVGASPFLALAITPAGFALASFLTRRYFQGAQGSGIPQVIAALDMRDPERIGAVLSLRVAFGKIALTLLGVASGAAIGREGPTIQIGAAIMRAAGHLLDLPREAEQRALLLAGGAAGIAAAFNAPLAGVVFAIEELSRSFEHRGNGIVLTAVIVSGMVTIALTGNDTYFGATPAALPVGLGWLAVVACAIPGGIAGGAFAATLVRAADGLPGRAGRFIARHPVGFAALCGLVLAVTGLVSHGNTYGSGYIQARDLLAGKDHLPARFFLLKLAATAISYCSGIPGGIFAPSLTVGAALGGTIAGLLPAAHGGAVVLLGMVAYFAGVVQAPLTATVIVMELTDSRDMTIPLLATSFMAFGVSRLVCRRPLYLALAQRFQKAVEG